MKIANGQVLERKAGFPRVEARQSSSDFARGHKPWRQGWVLPTAGTATEVSSQVGGGRQFNCVGGENQAWLGRVTWSKVRQLTTDKGSRGFQFMLKLREFAKHKRKAVPDLRALAWQGRPSLRALLQNVNGHKTQRDEVSHVITFEHRKKHKRCLNYGRDQCPPSRLTEVTFSV